MNNSVYLDTTNDTKISRMAIFVAILIFARCQPYYLWMVDDFTRIFCAIVIPLLVLMNSKVTKENQLAIFVFFVSFAVLSTHRVGVLKVINVLLLTILPAIKDDFSNQVYRSFRNIYCALLIPSILNYILMVIGVAHPWSIIPPLNGTQQFLYYAHPFLISTSDAHTAIPRFCGLFDEPGCIGTFCGLMLFIEKYDFRKWQCKAMLLAGVLAFSFFFFATLLLIPLVKNRNIKTFFKGAAVFAVVYALLMNVPILYEQIGKDFEWDADRGTFAGDTRTSERLNEVIASERFSYAYWMGHEKKDTHEFAEMASAQMYGYREGFLFLYLSIAANIILAFSTLWHRDKYAFMLFCIIFLMNTFQRPGFYLFPYIFIFIHMTKELKSLNSEKETQ